MNFVRTSRFLVASRCNVLNYYRSSAKICTTMSVQKAEVEVETAEKPYPFISKLKEGKFEVEDISDEDINKYKINYARRMFLCASSALAFISFILLRGPKEIDESIEHMLKNNVAGFEEYELLIAIDKAKKNGLKTADLEAKLIEVRKKLSEQKGSTS